jgi:hypothetical protein
MDDKRNCACVMVALHVLVESAEVAGSFDGNARTKVLAASHRPAASRAARDLRQGNLSAWVQSRSCCALC